MKCKGTLDTRESSRRCFGCHRSTKVSDVFFNHQFNPNECCQVPCASRANFNSTFTSSRHHGGHQWWTFFFFYFCVSISNTRYSSPRRYRGKGRTHRDRRVSRYTCYEEVPSTWRTRSLGSIPQATTIGIARTCLFSNPPHKRLTISILCRP